MQVGLYMIALATYVILSIVESFPFIVLRTQLPNLSRTTTFNSNKGHRYNFKNVVRWGDTRVHFYLVWDVVPY